MPRTGLRAECEVAPTVQGRPRSRAEKTEAKVCKVATLARAGSSAQRPPSPVTRDMVQEITSLYPTDPKQALPLATQISHIFALQTVEFIPLIVKRMPRLSEPGPLCMRAEHWYDFCTRAGEANLFSLNIAHIATATLPDAVLQYLRAGQAPPLGHSS